jgi:transposase, IS5 family
MQSSFYDLDNRYAQLSKQGDTPNQWTAKQAAHKDVDARWSKKNQQSHDGYKDHINVDYDTKLITQWVATDTSVHDSQAIEAVLRSLEQGGTSVHADSAYRSAEIEQLLSDKQLISQVHERAYKDKPLNDTQNASNKAKSKIRARVKHVFGHMQTAMGGMLIRCIGMARAHVAIGLMNLTYNLTRIECLIRTQTIKLNTTGKIGAPCVG